MNQDTSGTTTNVTPINSNVLLLLVGVLLMSCGCGSKPALVPASGTVTLEGKPLPAGRILFEPVGSDDLVSAVGDIQDGAFELFTHEEGDGVQPGTYYPTVMNPKEDDVDGGKSKVRIGVIQLPKQTFEVTADGANEFEIVLTKEDLKWAVNDD